MKIETNDHLPSLDVLVDRLANAHLGHFKCTGNSHIQIDYFTPANIIQPKNNQQLAHGSRYIEQF